MCHFTHASQTNLLDFHESEVVVRFQDNSEWLLFTFFLRGDIHQEKVAFETTTFGWVCPGMLNHAQMFEYLL